MSGSQKKIFYWDTCIFIAYLNGDVPSEAGHKEFLPDIDKLVQENMKGENIIVTSQISVVEVIHTLEDPDQEEKFLKLFNGRGVQSYDVDPRVASKAREIRFHFHKNEPGGKKPIATPDAIHLATAAILKVDEMHTFDDGRRDRNSLLALSEHPFLKKLKIVRPRVEQPELPNIENPEIEDKDSN